MRNKIWHNIERPHHSQIKPNRVETTSIVPAGARILRPVDDDHGFEAWGACVEGAQPEIDHQRRLIAEVRIPAGYGSWREPELQGITAQDSEKRVTAWRPPGIRQERKIKRYKPHNKF